MTALHRDYRLYVGLHRLRRYDLLQVVLPQDLAHAAPRRPEGHRRQDPGGRGWRRVPEVWRQGQLSVASSVIVIQRNVENRDQELSKAASTEEGQIYSKTTQRVTSVPEDLRS